MDCSLPGSSVQGILQQGASRAAPGKSGLHAHGEGVSNSLQPRAL